MHGDPTLDYDSDVLRKKCIASKITDSIEGDFSISRSRPGLHQAQRGSFEISTEKVVIGVCVWEGGVVEIQTHEKDGDTLDTETVRGVSIEMAVEKIHKHIRKHA